ncbi:DNA polymerase iota-like isoform X2 [Hoplias malabaricus]|uniref:DNA polymerase iota-like isoform X2 n=1 Tax=Hoplias malabaricus TaxID=27720 RepID=UPI0034630E23
MDSGEEEETGWDVDPVSEVGNQAVDLSERVILHFDLDCFYAQVEMIRNPALRTKPLGVQQKYIVVTCNYVARERGVKKLMGLKEALDKCPDLVLVNGEDLTHYREISYRVTELLMSYCPLVERLGFDENFVDVTDLVEKRMKETSLSNLSFVGHIFEHEVCVQDHCRLAVGSVIAAEFREAVQSRLGLTSCAGVANSKLLAKLVSGTFKPNQQTTLLPESRGALMDSLSGLRKVPGIGYKTGEKLKALGVDSVRDLQLFPLRDLIREFGEANAKRIQNLACGIDLSPVTPAGPPQSLSDEDSFRRISTVSEVESKVKVLLSSLCERMSKDGRLPQTLRLTLRRASADPLNRWFSRESRQCPVPRHTAHRILTDCRDVVPHLVFIAMKLFHRLVDVSTPFHLTLLNVCFSNLQNKTSIKNPISSFFTQTTPAATHTQETDFGVCEDSSSFTQIDKSLNNNRFFKHITPSSSASPSSSLTTQPNNAKSSTSPGQQTQNLARVLDRGDSTNAKIQEEVKSFTLPHGVDPDVFQALPEHIQRELMNSFKTGASVPDESMERSKFIQCTHSGGQVDFHMNQQKTSENGSKHGVNNNESGTKNALESLGEQSLQDSRAKEGAISQPFNAYTSSKVPCNVDPLVFSQLPSEMQRELLTEWKQQKPALKISSKQAMKPSSKNMTARDRRTTPKGSQNNNLLKYFKPS